VPSARSSPPNCSGRKNGDPKSGDDHGIREHGAARQCVKKHEGHAESDERNDCQQEVLWNSDALGQTGGHSFRDVTAGPMQDQLRKHPPDGERGHELHDGAAEQREPAVYSTTIRS
jgi:hypothetical protein